MKKGKFFILFLALGMAVFSLVETPYAQLLVPGGNGYLIPNYFGTTPNWANSPPLTKFVDTLPGLNTLNNLGQMIPVAVPDTATYPGSDYYVIELVEYREQMHSDLLPVVGAKTSPAATGGTKLRGYRQVNHPGGVQPPYYLGPLIVATKYDINFAPEAPLPTGGLNGKPVRILFINSLPTGAGGNLFLPTDTTIMGSGRFEINYNPETKEPIAPISGNFTQNRANLHLHGGRTPWISDGTAHQWITPSGETTDYPKGVSVSYVPDMWFDAAGNTIGGACAGQTTCATPGATNNPGPGKATYFYTNQQSARLLFYHDHAWGITRLNVYAGMAAGYLIRDAVELALINGGTINGRAYNPGTIPSIEIPLIIQDKTFVDGDSNRSTYVMNTDPTWAWGSDPGKPVTPTPTTGDLWWPHVYMPAQNPFNPDMSGINPMGRWVYGPWFWPPTKVCGSEPGAVPPLCIQFGPINNPYNDPIASPSPLMPSTPNPSWGAEAFMDTIMVNGTAYPKLNVPAAPVRFRVLNAGHDRFVNLQMYLAVNKNGYTNPTAAPYNFAGPVTDLTEVAMVPAATTAGFPEFWPTDGREGGVPDPATRGPAFIQIGTEGGFLPAPVVLPNQPVNWNTDVTTFNAGNVLNWADGGGTLMLGPAERADVIVDFTNFAGKTLILYNDAPAPWPALDPHYDYYTGAPDRRAEMGGADAVLPGMGPNIRTVMQIVVAGSNGTAPPDDYNPAILTALQGAFASDATPGAFASSNDEIIVGQGAYGTGLGNTSAYNTSFPTTWPEWGISRISDTSISFRAVDGSLVSNYPMKAKAIQDEMGEVFDEYGRMSAKLGLEVPFTNAGLNNFNLQNFVDPATEIVTPGKIQIWKITHNGVDTHPVHFHLFDVQVLNRVGWDGFIRLPDANELGWKDTVRISPLEDTIVALRPVLPRVPFAVPNSIRPLHPAKPIGSGDGFSNIDPATGQPVIPPTTNQLTNFGHEYVWHCHILSHEESDMMRPMILRIPNKIGVYDNGIWYLDANGNGAWDGLPTDKIYYFGGGVANAQPVTGDWNNKGATRIGIYADGAWYLDLNGDGAWNGAPTDALYYFGGGMPGALAVTGDWTGTGTTKIGIYDPATGNWYLDYNGNGAWDGPGVDGFFTFNAGIAGALPVAGSWDGSGRAQVGVFKDGVWYLDLNGNGVWDGAAGDLTYTNFGAGLAGVIPTMTDWAGTGKPQAGVYLNGTWYVDYSGDGAWNGVPTDVIYNFGGGLAAAVPVNGNW